MIFKNIFKRITYIARMSNFLQYNHFKRNTDIIGFLKKRRIENVLLLGSNKTELFILSFEHAHITTIDPKMDLMTEKYIDTKYPGRHTLIRDKLDNDKTFDVIFINRGYYHYYTTTVSDLVIIEDYVNSTHNINIKIEEKNYSDNISLYFYNKSEMIEKLYVSHC